MCANIKWINVNTLCWFICICICTHTICATRPATIISSPIGKPAVKVDLRRRYRDIVTDFHTISQYKKIPRFEPYTGAACCTRTSFVVYIETSYLSGTKQLMPPCAFSGGFQFIWHCSTFCHFGAFLEHSQTVLL